MDDQWASGVLEYWIRGAERVGEGDLLQARRGPDLDQLRAREHPTRVVVQDALGLYSLPTLVSESPLQPGLFYLNVGLEEAKYALSVVRTRAELETHAVTPAPRMAADALHPTIWQAARVLWIDQHYGQAVQRAATLLNAQVQDMAGRYDVSDVSLMQQVFSLSEPESGRPRLRWPGTDNDLTVKAMRSGILNFAQGCFSAIRNPLTHGSGVLDMQVALEQLATLSTLARWIDKCELVNADGTSR